MKHDNQPLGSIILSNQGSFLSIVITGLFKYTNLSNHHLKFMMMLKVIDDSTIIIMDNKQHLYIHYIFKVTE